MLLQKTTFLPLFLPHCFSETPSKTLKAKLQTTENHLKTAAQWFPLANNTTAAYNSSVLFIHRVHYPYRETTHTYNISIVILTATLTDLAEVLELVLGERSDKSIGITSVIRKLFTGNAPIPPLLQIIHNHFYRWLRLHR